MRSPGRINLIGEHTDYNDGFVVPAAIDKEIIFAIAPSVDSTSRIIALNPDQQIEVDLKNPQPVKSPAWANYVLGVIRQLLDRGYQLKPFVCVFGGNIPAGSGLSSSAALECGFAYALQQLNALDTLSKVDLAMIGQWSEHNFVGVKCGIMDQFANMMGKEDQVIQLDCRYMEHRYLPMPRGEYSIVLFNSGVKHSLASSEYNMRRAECEEGVHILQKKYPAIKSLRDVASGTLEENRSLFPDNVFNRCSYVASEIERVQAASANLVAGDIHSFGKKMYETHAGLSALYKVSCRELDFLVELAGNFKDVIGSRMMGGGFGGCTINIISNRSMDTIISNIREKYINQFHITPEVYTVKITDGTGLAGLTTP